MIAGRLQDSLEPLIKPTDGVSTLKSRVCLCYGLPTYIHKLDAGQMPRPPYHATLLSVEQDYALVTESYITAII